MGHHKRRRPKNRRGGCLLCKPHKANGCAHGNPTQQERKGRQLEREQNPRAFVSRGDPGGW